MKPEEFAQQVNTLTNHQWKLLEVLIKAQGKWVSRREIAQQIGKRRLIPYDINCLQQLEERLLIVIQHIHDDTPIGYQVVYRASDETLGALKEINELRENSIA